MFAHSPQSPEKHLNPLASLYNVYVFFRLAHACWHILSYCLLQCYVYACEGINIHVLVSDVTSHYPADLIMYLNRSIWQ